MRPQQEHRDSLKHISMLLARIHKGLMDYQMHYRELRTGQTLAPVTKLQLLLHDPEFAWLRILSQLMTIVDDAIFQKEPLMEEQVQELKKQVYDLLVAQSQPEFARRFNTIRPNVPALIEEHEKLTDYLKG